MFRSSTLQRITYLAAHGGENTKFIYFKCWPEVSPFTLRFQTTSNRPKCLSSCGVNKLKKIDQARGRTCKRGQEKKEYVMVEYINLHLHEMIKQPCSPPRLGADNKKSIKSTKFPITLRAFGGGGGSYPIPKVNF